MKQIFADTFYWVALTNTRDDWHQRVLKVTATLNLVQIITTDEVLTEVLNFLCTYGRPMRRRTTQFIKDIMSDSNIHVIQQTRDSFLQGLMLYEQRLDKEYSLTDCISMQTIKQMDITEIPEGVTTISKTLSQQMFERTDLRKDRCSTNERFNERIILSGSAY